MGKLFVEKAIEIHAPASKVWDVLTNPALTREWIKEWWPDLVILESDWNGGMGSENNFQSHTMLGIRLQEPAEFRVLDCSV